MLVCIACGHHMPAHRDGVHVPRPSWRGGTGHVHICRRVADDPAYRPRSPLALVPPLLPSFPPRRFRRLAGAYN
ncbi:MAG: hypothetical protein ACK56I_03620, partial [bacterium]